MNSVISCQHLTHYYGKRKIYEDLNFEVPEGRILGLLGKNGTGKTTTINILSGYLKPRSGTCQIFGQDIQTMDPALRRRIGLLIEGHVQYQFMNIEQIERFYASFYPGQWRKEAYYELMAKLKVAPRQMISRMSCGQRSQVALGLILAQNPDLLVLDDFSIGLDPGYRRLFVDYLREFVKAERKTVFLTSHIIQDMERLVDDCIIMDYGRILTQQPLDTLLDTLHRFTARVPEGYDVAFSDADLFHPSVIRGTLELHSFLSSDEVSARLTANGVPFSDLHCESLNLEDAFIGLTGKY
ncbi:MAG: ABC transporter ATP-binding protein [Bacteroidales bacterium]|jgi:ABC-2 type transport system ATP-binding protein|nr:ABC transporter ATP-binding protein [Bacteroidales bacterium]MCR5362017.1 ABC transporter ATP-binding protein [Bacteroidales bacterium]